MGGVISTNFEGLNQKPAARGTGWALNAAADQVSEELNRGAGVLSAVKSALAGSVKKDSVRGAEEKPVEDEKSTAAPEDLSFLDTDVKREVDIWA